VMVIGWSGPGSFMVSSLFGQPVVIGRKRTADLQELALEYNATTRDVEGWPR
jgi:hypothetical protein